MSYCTCTLVGVSVFPCGMVHREIVIHTHQTPTFAHSYTHTRTHMDIRMDTPFQKESVHCWMNSIPIPDLASAQSKLSSELRNRSSIRTEPLRTPVSACVCVDVCEHVYALRIARCVRYVCMCVHADRRLDGRVNGRVVSAADYGGYTGDPVI